MSIYNRNPNLFIVFPLHALSMKLELKVLIQTLLDYGICNRAMKDFIKFKIHAQKLLHPYKYKDYNIFERLKRHNRIYKDGSRTDMIISEFEGKYIDFLEIYKAKKIGFYKIKKLMAGYKKKYGIDSNVMMHDDLLFEIIYRKVLSEEEFRILCAVYSKIGNSKFQAVFNDEIRCRAYGYMTQVILEDNNEKRLPYSNKVLRWRLDKLCKACEGRNFFDRVRDGRKYHYSRKLRGKELKMEIIRTKLKPIMQREHANSVAREIIDKVKTTKKELMGKKLTSNEIRKKWLQLNKVNKKTETR